MNIPKNYKQVLARFDRLPKEIKDYFAPFQELVENYVWSVSVAYVFSQIEQAKNTTIYCSIVKLHNTDSEITRKLLDNEHMTRQRFEELYKTIIGKPIDKDLLKKLKLAEAVRDKILHGKEWTDQAARTALTSVFDFVEGFNETVHKQAGFRPFGSLRGFKGRKTPLSKETTRWVLRGMDIPKKQTKQDNVLPD